MPNNTQQRSLFSKTAFTSTRGDALQMKNMMDNMSTIITHLEREDNSISNEIRGHLEWMHEQMTALIKDGEYDKLDNSIEEFGLHWDAVNLLWDAYQREYNDHLNEKGQEEKENYKQILNLKKKLETDMVTVNRFFQSLKAFNKFLDERLATGAERDAMLDTADKITLTGHCPTIYECLAMKPEKMTAMQILDRLFWLAQHQSDFLTVDRTKPANEQEKKEKSVYGYAFRRLKEYLGNCDSEQLEKLTEAYIQLKQGLHIKAEQKYEEILAEIPEGPEKENMALVMLSETQEYNSFMTADAMFGFMPTISVNCIDMWNSRAKNEKKDFVAPYSKLNNAEQKGPVERAGDMLEKYLNNKQDPDKADIGKAVKDRIYTRSKANFEETGKISNIRSRIAETYYDIRLDKRRASKSFDGMRRSLHNLLNRAPEHEADPKAYFENLEEAKKKVQEYLNSHKGHRVQEKGRDRVAWANALKAQLAELSEDPAVKKLSENFRQQMIDFSAKKIRNYIAKLENPNGADNLGDYENKIRLEYARMLYHQTRLQKQMLISVQTEEEEFNQFLRSKAFAATFAGKDVYSLKRLVAPAEPGAERAVEKQANGLKATFDLCKKQIFDKVDKNTAQLKADREKLEESLTAEIQLLRGYEFLNDIPRKKTAPHGQMADKYISAIQNKKLVDSNLKSLFFPDYLNPKNLHEFSKIVQGRLGVSAGRSAYDTLALGVMLEKGISFDKAMDIYGSHKARIDAGKSVVNAHNEMSDDQFAAFAGAKFHAVLEKLIAYVDDTVSEMGGISLDKMTDPKYKNLRSAIIYLMDAGQEVNRKEIKEWLVKNKPEYENLVNKQKFVTNTLGTVEPVDLLTDAVKSDIHVNVSGYQTDYTKLASNLLPGYACQIISEEMKRNPGRRLSEMESVTDRFESKSASAKGALLSFTNQIPVNELSKKGVYGSFLQSIIQGRTPKRFSFVTTEEDNGIYSIQNNGFSDLLKQSKDEAKALQKKIDKNERANHERVNHEAGVIENNVQEAQMGPVIGR